MKKQTDFRVFFQLFTASVRSHKPEPPLVPGVFLVVITMVEIMVVVMIDRNKGIQTLGFLKRN